MTTQVRGILERDVVKRWRRDGIIEVNPHVHEAQAAVLAVDEVVAALKNNPGWARMLGISA